VIATDASADQLANGRRHPRVEYRRAPAEASGLPDAVVDLAVSAQAAHWFDLPGYYAEVRRVARPGAIVALVTYGRIRVEGDIDPVIERFHGGVLGSCWPPERRSVDDGYRSLSFPFEEIPVPPMEMRVQWALGDFFGYVYTWSATQALERAEGRGPIEAFKRDLARVWGPAGTVRPVHWDLTLRVGRL
jgi:SAM-dependent methyltransferase